MDKITAFIVDDEKSNREVLARLLDDFDEVAIAGEAADVESAYHEIFLKKPDLVFLDIQMPKANGFALLKMFDVIPFEVVFVTSFDQYAITAIKFSALDYLLKPVEVEELRQAFSKAIKIISQKQNSRLQLNNLLKNLDDRQRNIAVHVGEKVKFIGAGEIEYIQADGRYCHIFLRDGQSHVTAKYLKDFEDYFIGEGNFIRIDKSHLLHLKEIVSYSKGDPCIIEMRSGKTFEASRRKKQEVLARLQSK